MSACPVQHSLKQSASSIRICGQSFAQGGGIVFGKVGKLNAMPDVKGRGARVPNQVRWSCYAEQGEGQAIQLSIMRSAIVEFANAGKKLIG